MTILFHTSQPGGRGIVLLRFRIEVVVLPTERHTTTFFLPYAEVGKAKWTLRVGLELTLQSFGLVPVWERRV